MREQKILLWVEAPAEKLKAPESGLNLAIRKLGAIDRLLGGIEAKYKRIASMTLPGIGGGRGGGTSIPASSSSSSSSSVSSGSSGAGRIITEITNEKTGQVKELVTALNDAETLLRRARATKKGETVVIIDKQQLDRARSLSVELNNAKTALKGQLAIAESLGTEQSRLAAQARAYRDFQNAITTSGSAKTPAQAAAFDRIASEAGLAAAKKEAAVKELTDQRRLANEERGAKLRSEQEKKLDADLAQREKARSSNEERGLKLRTRQEMDAEAAIAKARVEARAKAEDDAVRAQTAAFNAAQKGTPAQNRVAGLQGRVAYLNSLKGSGTLNPSQLLALTNSLAVAQATLATATAAVNQQYSHVGKNMVQNVAHVTAWAAAVGTLYGSLRLLKFGADSVLELEYQTARLTQVFRRTEQEVPKLVDQVLQLAAANGRTSKEAMDSAIQWSRLNLNRVQVAEAVRVSLMGANVAELTAAQSTEHLASLYQVYGLRVSELNSVLGMLNQTSNTYNVTNKALLEGITRTSAAAKQAGIGLAELIGLIGAGEGSTGQTGPNIGNALKSFIGSISSPDKQKLLRDQFQFEVTVGGTDEVKSMSGLLAELFVTFQRRSQAERQSMIFNVAGKNQASRLTAILDNYIRAQTLAINAQLKLNSAERENEAIRATARARLQGLITEIERFANSAANFGKDATGLSALVGFSEVVLAMKNSLAAFNGGPGAMMLGLVAAIAAKSLVMMTVFGQTGKQGGVLANSMLGLAGAFKDVNAALLKGLTYHPKWIQNMAGIKVAADGAAVATKGLGKALAVAVAVAAVELAAVAAVVFTISKLINFGSEKLGFSSDSADKAMQDMTQKAEAAKGAAEAAQTQMRLFATMQRALAANPSQGGRASMIAQMVEGVPEGRRAALKMELDGINTQGNAIRRNAAFKRVFDRETADAAQRSAVERARQHRIELDNIRALRSEIFRLENSASAGLNKDAIQKKKDQLAELQNKGIARVMEDVEGQEESSRRFRETNQGHLIFLEKQKGLLETIKDLYAQIPGDSALDGHRKTIFALETQSSILSAQLQVINEQRAALGGAVEAHGGDASRRDEFRIAAARAKQMLQDLQAAASSGGNGPIDITALRDAMADARRMRLRVLNERAGGPITLSANRDESLRLGEQARELAERKAQADRDLAAQRQMQEAARYQDRMGLVSRIAAARSDSFAFGSSETDKLRNQIDYNAAAARGHEINVRALELQLKTERNLQTRLMLEKQIADEKQAALVHEGAMQKEAEQLLVRKFQLEQQARQAEKDFTKQMMFDSPGNILKRMAMDKLTNGGRNLRGFIGFDEAGRNMLRPQVENRMEQAENKRARDAFPGGLNGPQDLVRLAAANEAWRARLQRDVGEGMRPMIVAAAAASLEVGKLQTAAAGAAAVINQFAAAIRTVLGHPVQGPPANAQAP